MRVTSIAKMLVIASLAVTTADAAPDTLDKARNAGKIIVGVGVMGTRPMVWQQPDGSYAGYEYDIMQAVIKRIGIASSDYAVTEWTTLIPGLNSGRWDMIASGMVKTEERVQGAHIAMSRPYFFFHSVIVVPAASNVKSVADLKGKVLAATLGTTDSMAAHFLVEQGLATDVRDLNDFQQPFAALHNRQVDAVIMDQVTTLGQMNTNKDIKIVGDPIYYQAKPEWSNAQATVDYKLVPLHSGFDGLSVSGIERGQVGAVHLDGDAPSCAGVA